MSFIRTAAVITVLPAFFAAPQPPLDHPGTTQAVGTVRFRTSCTAAATPMFNRSVALLHSFAFAQATEAFNGVLRTDPRCAMAWWGIALGAWGNPFAAGIKAPSQVARGLDAVGRARTTGTPTPRESRYIEAVARLYERADSIPQGVRLVAYRDAMADLVAREPADTEAAIFHALAVIVAADPTDKSYAGQLAAGATFERFFARLPDHPGLAHYIIHSYDVPPLAGRALAAANRYARIAPDVSHALHMPSHTYTRRGFWQQSVDANVASAATARREGSTAEELHADDYRTYAYLQMAQDRAARRLLDSLGGIAARFDPTAVGAAAPPAAGFYALAAIPARYALERGAWAEAAALTVRPSPMPFTNAVTLFARGLGAARSGNASVADSAALELERLRDALVKARESYWSEQVEIQRRAVVAWREFAAGRRTEALAAMGDAADREDATEKNAIMPGPIAPARELLGEMLLEAHEPARALAAFIMALQHEPNRFRAIAGAVTAASRAGDAVAARTYSMALLKLGERADQPGRPALAEARRVLGR